MLPPANAQERKARQAKTPKDGKVTEAKQGVGGRSGEAKSQPKAKQEPAPKPAPEPKYATDSATCPSAWTPPGRSWGATSSPRPSGSPGRPAGAPSVAASTRARSRTSRPPSPTWRSASPSGEFVKAERAPKAKAASKADLEHRIDTAVAFVQAARGDKGVTKSGLIDGVLTLLNPPTE